MKEDAVNAQRRPAPTAGQLTGPKGKVVVGDCLRSGEWFGGHNTELLIGDAERDSLPGMGRIARVVVPSLVDDMR